MKKVICFVMFVFLSLLFVPNVTYAQSKDISPQVIAPGLPVNLRALEYHEYYFVQEHERVYEYLVIYYLPYRYNVSPGRFGYFIFYKWEMSFQHGSLSDRTNSYVFEEIKLEEDRTVFHFRFTFVKSVVDDYYSGNVETIFARDSAMYYGINVEDAYQRGFNDGVKSITNKYTSYVIKWTLPFVTLVILSGIYIGFKREWFKE